MSKRFLQQLVKEQQVSGWDDPRMPTIQGLRRRGYPARGIRVFCERVGISKADSTIEMAVLEQCVRDVLNEEAPRAFAIKKPLAIEISNLDEDHQEVLEAPAFPHKPESTEKRPLPFGKHLWIEEDDFMENPPPKYFRLQPGGEVRLRYGYIIKCEKVEKDPLTGKVSKLICSYDAQTLGQNPVGRKVKGVIHWLEQKRSLPIVIHEFGRLFKVPHPSASEPFATVLNPESHKKNTKAFVEAGVREYPPETSFQFERLGYYCIDRFQKAGETLQFNETVSLKESFD